MQRTRALVITAIYPRPDIDSGSVSVTNLMRMLLALGLDVSHMAVDDFNSGVGFRNRLSGLGVSTIHGSDWPSPQTYLEAEGRQFQVVVLSTYLAGAQMYETVRRCCPDARIIFNAGDVHHLRIDREARLTDPRLAARAADAKEKETFLVRNTDATIVVSDVELQYLNKLVPGANVIHVPLIRDIPGSTKGYAERADIAFVGYFLHPPNPDAVQLFVSAIWPRVKAALPDVRLKLIGAFWPQQIPRPSGPGIEMVGHVQDLGAALEKLRLTVAPLRFGAGAKGKIVSSLSHGVPCVATPIATEGMGLVDGVSVLVADRTDLFAQKVIAAYRDEALWNRLSAGGLEAVRRNHSFENGLRLIGGMLAGIGVAPPMAEAS